LFYVLDQIFWPDTGGYLGYADFILEQGNIFAKEKFGLAAIQTTYFRMFGYPVFIAISKILFGDFWPKGLVILQFLISAVASFYVYRFSRLLNLSKGFSLFVCFSYATGAGLVFDFSILTDSFFASFLVMALFYAVRSVSKERHIAYRDLFLSTFFLICCLLLREGAFVLSLCFMPWFILGALKETGGFFMGSVRFVKLCISFYAPLITIVIFLQMWNHSFSGYYFLATGMQAVYFQRPIELVYDGLLSPGMMDYLPNDYQSAAEAVFKKFVFYEIIHFNDLLYKNFDLNAIQILEIGKHFYMKLWMAEPGLMFLGVLKKMKFLLFLEQSFRPLGFFKDLSKYTDYFTWVSFRNLRLGKITGADISVGTYLLYVGNMLTQAFSLCVGFAFVGLPLVTWYAFARGLIKRIDVLNHLSLWFTVWIFYGVYALIHVEIRYMIAIIPLMFIGGIRAFQTLNSLRAARL
jgi:hypothetical protein